jgi:cation-transporting P-type ATPase 13A2
VTYEIQIFDGPTSGSVPTSVSSFAHRRQRADSTVSFTYFQDDEDSEEWREDESLLEYDENNIDLEAGNGFVEQSEEVELGDSQSFTRNSSSRSRQSIEVPLLGRRDSVSTEGESRPRLGRIKQKVYIAPEDLTIVIAGFNTSTVRSVVYGVLSIATFGVLYLLFRWLPRWRIRLIGSPASLKDCEWVVIEVSDWRAW